MPHAAALPASPRPTNPATPPARHAPATIVLHWATVGALLLAIAAIGLRELIDAEPWHGALLVVHRQAALAALLLLLPRLVARAAGGLRAAATLSAGLPTALRLAGAASHAVLYLGLLAVPLLGSALSDARGQHQAWLGWLPLPRLAATDPDLADTLADWHAGVAWVLLGLVLLHTVAALWHHLVRRDGVLRAMWPVALNQPNTPHTSDVSTSSHQP